MNNDVFCPPEHDTFLQLLWFNKETWTPRTRTLVAYFSLSFTSRWVSTTSLSCCDFIFLTPVSSYRTNTICAWWRRTPRTRTSRNTSPCATTSSTPLDCAVATCSSTGESTLHPCPISIIQVTRPHSLTH